MELVELMELIAEMIKSECGLELRLDGLPQKGGLCAELSAGYNYSMYYSKNAIIVIPVLFLSKDRDQSACIAKLSNICRYFQGLKKYPAAKSFSWLDAATATYPNKVGRQEDGQYIYSAVVNMKLYI